MEGLTQEIMKLDYFEDDGCRFYYLSNSRNYNYHFHLMILPVGLVEIFHRTEQRRLGRSNVAEHFYYNNDFIVDRDGFLFDGIRFEYAA